MSERTSYEVAGMTCEHCVRAVEAEVGALPGVAEVAVDLPAGRVAVVGDDVRDDAVRAAVAEAGYEVVAPAKPA